MFGDKLWDKANDQKDQEQSRGEHHGNWRKGDHQNWKGKHHKGQHGKHHGDHHKGMGFCPVMMIIYIALAGHLIFLKQYTVALSDLNMLTQVTKHLNRDIESRNSPAAFSFFNNVMGGQEPKRK
jgi:hypothetical protein